MLKFRLIAGSPDRLAKLLDSSDYDIETSRMDETLANEFGEARDDSPTDEVEAAANQSRREWRISISRSLKA